MEIKINEDFKTEEILEYIRDNLPDSLLANGYDSAIIAIASGFASGRVVYSITKMLEICMRDLSVDVEEAMEWLEYNTFGAFVGDYTPIYIYDYLV